MKRVHEFIDNWGLLDKLYKPDGGDTAQREGMYFSLLAMMSGEHKQKYLRSDTIRYFNDQYAEVMKQLHPSPGVILRHSNPDYDSSDWDRMSRDQLQPMIIAAGLWSKNELKKLTSGHAKRAFLFCVNTRRNGATKTNHGKFVEGETRDYSWKLPDLTGPEIWANFTRAHGAWWLFPMLLILDLEILFGAIKWRYFPKHNIAMNQTLSMMQGWHIMRTPWTWLAIKICPIPYMIKHIEDHFNDLHPDMDMQFFGPMFKASWESIK